MTVELRRIISQPPVTGEEGDPVFVVVEGISITTFFKEDSITAAAAAPTVNTIVTQAFVLGTFEKLVLIQASATNYSKFLLKVNGTIISTKRSGPGYNVEFDFTGAPYELIIGDTVTVEEIHASGTLDAEATIFGYS